MPYSSPATDAPVKACLAFLKQSKIAKALDVGVGAGKYGAMLHEVFPGIVVHGIEGWAKYVVQFNEAYKKNYASVVNVDAREWFRTTPEWQTDLVVFGDVLEHLGYSEALDMVHRAAYHCRYMLLVWPERRLQGVYEGNELEVHSCVLLPSDFARFEVVAEKTDILADKYVKHVLLLRGLRA